MTLEEAENYVEAILLRLEPFSIRASPVGSVRRKEPIIGDLDIVMEIWKSDLKAFKLAVQQFSTLHSGGEKKIRIGNIFNNPQLQADIWLVYPPRSYTTLLGIFTGPDHVTIKLRENLLRNGYRRPHGEIRTQSEKQLFDIAGLPFLPPEERHKIE